MPALDALLKPEGLCELPHSGACLIPAPCARCSGQLESHCRSCIHCINKVMGSPRMSLRSFGNRGVEGGTGEGLGHSSAASRPRLCQKAPAKKIIPLQENLGTRLFRETSFMYVVPRITITVHWDRTLKYFNKESVRFRRQQEGSMKTEKEKSLMKAEFPGKAVH